MRARGKRWARVLIPVACSLAFASREARANGRLPAAHELVFSATDPSFVVIEATFGLFVSHDTGASFGWVCEPAIGYPSTAELGPADWNHLHVRPGRTISAGRSRSRTDQGCSWQVTLTALVVDIVVRADDPHSALALASSYSGLNDAGETEFSTQVFATHDDGATWAQQGVTIEPDVQVETIDIAPSDPNTIYIGGARTLLDADGSVNRTGIVLASTNGGASYVATTIALQLPNEFESSAFVSAVDPDDAAAGLRAYQRIRRNSLRGPAARQRRRRRDLSYRLPGERRPPRLRAVERRFEGLRRRLRRRSAPRLRAPAADSGAPFSFAQTICHRSSVASPGLRTSSTLATGQPQNPYLEGARRLERRRRDLLSRVPVRLRQRPALLPSERARDDLRSGAGRACSPSSAPAPTAGAPRTEATRMHLPPITTRASETARPRSASCGCDAGETAGEVGGLSAIALVVAMMFRRRRA